jgi:hypothetical protein
MLLEGYSDARSGRPFRDHRRRLLCQLAPRTTRLGGRRVHPTAEAGRLYLILRPRLRQVESLPDQSRLDLCSSTDQTFVQSV